MLRVALIAEHRVLLIGHSFYFGINSIGGLDKLLKASIVAFLILNALALTIAIFSKSLDRRRNVPFGVSR